MADFATKLLTADFTGYFSAGAPPAGGTVTFTPKPSAFENLSNGKIEGTSFRVLVSQLTGWMGERDPQADPGDPIDGDHTGIRLACTDDVNLRDAESKFWLVTIEVAGQRQEWAITISTGDPDPLPLVQATRVSSSAGTILQGVRVSDATHDYTGVTWLEFDSPATVIRASANHVIIDPNSGPSAPVMSVAMTGDGVVFDTAVPGSPITDTGTFAPALHSTPANRVLASPNGSAGVWQARQVVEADVLLADNTTNNVSTTRHGLAPKAPNDATKYLDGTGAYSVPAGGGGSPTGPAGGVLGGTYPNPSFAVDMATQAELDAETSARTTADGLLLVKASNLSDLTSASTARTNLGLGTAATTNTGTGATNTILGNDARLTDARTPTAHAASHATGGSDPLTEAVQDIVGALLVAGTNVTLTYDDTAGTLTIAATGGGGGSLTVKEVDGTPNVASVTTIRVPNGALTDDGSGQVTLGDLARLAVANTFAADQTLAKGKAIFATQNDDSTHRLIWLDNTNHVTTILDAGGAGIAFKSTDGSTTYLTLGGSAIALPNQASVNGNGNAATDTSLVVNEPGTGVPRVSLAAKVGSDVGSGYQVALYAQVGTATPDAGRYGLFVGDITGTAPKYGIMVGANAIGIKPMTAPTWAPTGGATLYVDTADNHLKFRKASGTVIDLG